MKKHSVYIKFGLPEYDTTAGKDMELFAENSFEAAKKAKELNKNKKLLYIEIADMEGSDGIKFYDGNTLEMYHTMQS